MTYRQLQAELKQLRTEGFTNIKLNSKKTALQKEYNRIQRNMKKADEQLAKGIIKFMTPRKVKKVTRPRINLSRLFA
jgi:hypothetical protein